MTDPRYDPRFQRGWSGPVQPQPAPSTPAPAPPVAPPTPPVVRAPVPPVVAAPVEPSPAEHLDEPDADHDLGPAHNPYRIALAVVGAVLVVASAGILWQLAQPMTANRPADYVLPQLELSIAPWVALAGFLAIIAAVALGAFRRR